MRGKGERRPQPWNITLPLKEPLADKPMVRSDYVGEVSRYHAGCDDDMR